MKPNCLIIFVALVFVGCSNDRLAVVSKQQVSVFEREADAAYEGSLNREPVKPVAILQESEEVSVLKDTYGKDYWVCKVKLKNNISGWALCTNLSLLGNS